MKHSQFALDTLKILVQAASLNPTRGSRSPALFLAGWSLAAAAQTRKLLVCRTRSSSAAMAGARCWVRARFCVPNDMV